VSSPFVTKGRPGAVAGSAWAVRIVRWSAGWALAGYVLVSFVAFGLRLVVDPGGQYVGQNDDPPTFIWSLAWWPHAILHGQNPFVTDEVWAPTGTNLAWATTVPLLALVLAPLTLTAGAVTAYNVAAVLMPAFAAWTCFLLCRRVTGSAWAAFAAGWLFGFSSYMLGQELAGHLNLTSAALVPLIALVVVDYASGRCGARGFVLRLGPLLAAQLLLSTELAAAATLALLVGLVLTAVCVPKSWPWLRTIPLPLAASYLVGAVLAAPFLYYLLSDFRSAPINAPEVYVADLANFVLPTDAQLVARATSDWSTFGGNIGENGAFLGLPLLAILALFAIERGRSPTGRFLIAAFATATLLALGPRLVVRGHRSLTLPWRLVEHVPVLDNLLTARFSLFVALTASVTAAIWAASSRYSKPLRLTLPILAIVVLVPDPVGQQWATGYTIPPFFTDTAYRTCLDPGEIVLPLPIGFRGQADLWQTAASFRFRMAGGRITPVPPPEFEHPAAIAQVASGQAYPDQRRIIPAYIRAKGVAAVILDERFDYKYRATLDSLAVGHDVGGIRLYNFARFAPGCLGT
jgi:hypothetical protein